MAVPMMTATSVPKPPMRKMLRVPTMIRLKMSRPNWSAPKGCDRLGASRRTLTFCAW